MITNAVGAWNDVIIARRKRRYAARSAEKGSLGASKKPGDKACQRQDPLHGSKDAHFVDLHHSNRVKLSQLEDVSKDEWAAIVAIFDDMSCEQQVIYAIKGTRSNNKGYQQRKRDKVVSKKQPGGYDPDQYFG